MTAFRLPVRAVVCAAAMGVLAAGSLVARADVLVTGLDPAGGTVNGQPEVLTLTSGTGTTEVSILATSGGGKDQPGCDLHGGTVVVHPWVNSTAVTVTPGTLSFTSCGEKQQITVTRTGPGHAMVKFAFDKQASSAGVTGPAVETAHFVVGGDAPVEGPGCTAPAAPAFDPDGSSVTWFTSVPTVSAANGGDAIGYALSAAGPFTATAPTLTDGTTTVFAQATNDCGDTVSDTTYAVDTTAPTVVRTATKADGTAYAPGTWTNQTVTVHTDCSDATSGVAACPEDVVVFADSADASGTTVPAVTVHDVAGNSTDAPAVVVKRDTVAPLVTVNGLVPTYWTGGAVPAPTCSASDALSGLASTSAPVVTPPSGVNGVGTGTVTCTAADNAGNTGSSSPTYTVVYGGIGSGWLQPILAGTRFSRGKAVPGKFKVGGSPALTGFVTTGWKITVVPQPTGSKLGCVAQVGAFTLKSLNTADLRPTMRWDPSGAQYVLNADFRTATVGSCWQLKAALDDSPSTTFSSGTFQVTN